MTRYLHRFISTSPCPTSTQRKPRCWGSGRGLPITNPRPTGGEYSSTRLGTRSVYPARFLSKTLLVGAGSSLCGSPTSVRDRCTCVPFQGFVSPHGHNGRMKPVIGVGRRAPRWRHLTFGAIFLLASQMAVSPNASAGSSALSWLVASHNVSGSVVIEALATPPANQSFIRWCLRLDGSPVPDNVSTQVSGYLGIGFDQFTTNGCWQNGTLGSATVGIKFGAVKFDTGVWSNGTHRLQFTLYTDTGRVEKSPVLVLHSYNAGPSVLITPPTGALSLYAPIDTRAYLRSTSTAVLARWCLAIDGRAPTSAQLVSTSVRGIDSIFSQTAGAGCWIVTPGTYFTYSSMAEQFVVNTVQWRNGPHLVEFSVTDSHGRSNTARRWMEFRNSPPQVIGIVANEDLYYGPREASEQITVTALRATKLSIEFHQPGRPLRQVTGEFTPTPNASITLTGLARGATYDVIVVVSSPNGLSRRNLTLRPS